MRDLLNVPIPQVSHILSTLLFFALGSTVHGQTPVDFVRDVRPIFQQHCYSCHSEQEQESGLRLDVKSLALKGGDNFGPDIIPGNAAASPLVQFVSASEDHPHLMPPGERLSSEQIAIIQQWVNQGAIWPDGVDLVELKDTRDHWSFKPLRDTQDFKSIDQFVANKLREKKLEFSPEADPITWLRRVTFDLTGLPPTLPETDQFLSVLSRSKSAGEREEAYSQVVERLLASQRYGERWGQHWLDVVRYADTHGFEVNTERPNAWPYRDYVIEAFNADKPYDQFIREQIVGDALDADSATGFLITASVLLPGQIGQDGASIRLARQDSLDEIVNNISQTFLGLSIGCARCHDHKFDPISAKDYYSMQAFVSGVEYEEREIPGPEAIEKAQQISLLRQQLEELVAAHERQSQENIHPTNAKKNVEDFEATEAKFVRFTIHDANHHPILGLIEPCIDEFEIYSSDQPSQNVALASYGTKVTASGSRTSSTHKLEFIHDGQYGNSSSWMADTNGSGWVMFELPQTAQINQVIWGRDRLGQFDDRLATAYTLEVGLSPESMVVVAGVEKEDPAVVAARVELEKQISLLEGRHLAFAGKFREPDEIFLLNRGDPEQPGRQVPPAVPQSLGELELDAECDEQHRRKRLADWLSSPENPLTARVMVNRIWHWHFGTGIVDTPSDLGNSGSSPTHPELLDWLSVEFIRSGWSVKYLNRLIVLSQTYRQSSDIKPQFAEIDADVRWLWRFPSRRLEAESIRDSMLAVAGLLNREMYGPGFDLFNQRGGLSGFDPIEELSSTNQRRMIYAHKVRREPEVVFGAFDCPDAGQSTAVRRISTTPIQALNLFNSHFTLDVADAFAEKVRAEVGADTRRQIEQVYRTVYLRHPTSEEREETEPIVHKYGLSLLCRVLMNSNEFLYIE